jgi:DsbC/DsbD-like thiol-disulfide interchange protein
VKTKLPMTLHDTKETVCTPGTYAYNVCPSVCLPVYMRLHMIPTHAHCERTNMLTHTTHS